MNQWRIEPTGVESVLNQVGEASDDLYDELTEEKFEGVFEGLTWGGGMTSMVPEAVSNVLEDQQSNLNEISNRVTAGQLGVFNATVAYNNGQQDMKESFHSEMFSSAESGNFDYFDANGYQGE